MGNTCLPCQVVNCRLLYIKPHKLYTVVPFMVTPHTRLANENIEYFATNLKSNLDCCKCQVLECLDMTCHLAGVIVSSVVPFPVIFNQLNKIIKIQKIQLEFDAQTPMGISPKYCY